MMEGLDEVGRAKALSDLRTSLSTHHTADWVVFDAATWIVAAWWR
jgi:hypothetical protein